MELGHIEFISFEQYKNKAWGSSNNNSSNKNNNLSNEEIEKEMLEVVRYYEQKAGGKNGNI